MESDLGPQEQLRAADRAEAAAWVDFPPTPGWYPPAVGLWAAVLALGVAHVTQWWGAACLVLAAAADLTWVRWYRGYRGAMPSGGMPAELRGPVATVVVGLVGAAAVVAVLAVVTVWWVGPLAALVVVTPLIAWYESAYARATAAARARLA